MKIKKNSIQIKKMKIWINQFYMKNTKKILKKMINNYLNLNSNQKMNNRDTILKEIKKQIKKMIIKKERNIKYKNKKSIRQN